MCTHFMNITRCNVQFNVPLETIKSTKTCDKPWVSYLRHICLMSIFQMIGIKNKPICTHFMNITWCNGLINDLLVTIKSTITCDKLQISDLRHKCRISAFQLLERKFQQIQTSFLSATQCIMQVNWQHIISIQPK